jgi:aminoglycoside phosphotransferase (APT) family kinase protein
MRENAYVIPPVVLEQLSAAGIKVHASAPTQTRGLKSDTFLITHDGGSAILKIYNSRGGTPVAKCTREWLALGSLESIPHIPHRLCHEPDSWLLMECLPGNTLRSQWDGLDQHGRRRICVELGAAYGQIASAPQEPRVHDLVRQSRPGTWVDSLPEAIANIDRLLQSEPRVAGSTFTSTAHRVRTLLESPSAPQLLVKADCNSDNTLADHGTLTGIIDWEQACIGDRWIHFGIVLDHTHFLDWTAVRAGIEDVVGPWSREDEELVLAAGYLCVWRKIIEFDARSAWFSDPSRQVNRMRAMTAAMGPSHAQPD